MEVQPQPASPSLVVLSELGIELICANSPQAKGRVERANQTLQDRLIKEMRLRESAVLKQPTHGWIPSSLTSIVASKISEIPQRSAPTRG